jgi:tRNA wybutosine-synthesizing protein 2
MGYLHDTWKYLPKAEELLNGNGIIHYHTTMKDSDLPEGIHKELQKGLDRDYEVAKLKKIKSYAPHVFHIVADVNI